ncbi:hypothetical protein cypCar_00022506 [Cyprinus carpio]|nr:hypothetical protein cypCar_00022506 [Cyprinus carpio]
MNQFAQVGMQQPMGQRRTPPLPMPNLNQMGMQGTPRMTQPNVPQLQNQYMQNQFPGAGAGLGQGAVGLNQPAGQGAMSQLSQKSSLMADGQASTPASDSSADPSSQLTSSEPTAPLDPKTEVKQQEEEDENETEDKASGKMASMQTKIKTEEKPEKEEPADDECKSEPMETSTGSTGEDKKPEVKTEPKEEEAAGTNSSPTNTQSKKKVFKPDELRQALMPTLEALYRQDPESLPFRQPVDPQLLGIPVRIRTSNKTNLPKTATLTQPITFEEFSVIDKTA